MRFEEVGEFYGLAYDNDGKATGAMGIDAGHFRNDSDLAVAIGNFANEMTSFYVRQGLSSQLNPTAYSRQKLDADPSGRLERIDQ